MATLSADSQHNNTVWLNIQDFEFLCFNFARETLEFREPIPDYTTRNIPLLESALSAPRQTFADKLLYPTLSSQASILFYSLIKNHPFINGNKRIALMALLVFLSLNNKWLSISSDLLYEVALNVAKSSDNNRDATLKRLTSLLHRHIIPYPLSPND